MSCSVLRVAVLLCTVGVLWVRAEDTLVYRFAPLTVIGRAIPIGERIVPSSKASVYEVLESEGVVQFIRRGGFLSTDLSLQGFRRGDVGVTVEGIRFPNACPNRMDVPLVRIEPLDVAGVVVDYSGVSIPGGFGGAIRYHRHPVGERLHVRADLAGQFGAEPFWDASLQAELAQQRLIGRFVQLRSYTDGAGQTFGQRYGYSSDHIRSQWLDMMLRGQLSGITYDVRFNTATDIPFPALMMDERRNLTGVLSLARGEDRLYGVYTWHRMDNELRRTTTPMRTDATTFTFGLVSPWYEAVYRFWKAETQMGGMSQAVIPSVSSFRATVGWRWALQEVQIALRGGVALMWLGDTSRLAIYRELYPEAGRLRWYLPVNVTLGSRFPLFREWSTGVQLEFTGEQPAEENLFFVRVAGHGPRWVSNPTLAEPLRLSLRTMLEWQRWAQLQLAASHVWNYPSLAAREHGMHRWLTVEGIRAWLWTATLSYTSPYWDASLEYTWGEQVQTRRPLSEIPPLMVILTGKSPELEPGLSLWVRSIYAMAQRRVDWMLREEPTGEWFRLDAGLQWKMAAGIHIGVEGTNLLNRLYRRHLSYIRNPYAAGTRVYEPGRSIRLSIRWQWEQHAN